MVKRGGLLARVGGVIETATPRIGPSVQAEVSVRTFGSRRLRGAHGARNGAIVGTYRSTVLTVPRVGHEKIRDRARRSRSRGRRRPQSW